ncbi:MAG: hypothetical protein AB1413_03040 [Thermodesulfobacteriota bacterium]
MMRVGLFLKESSEHLAGCLRGERITPGNLWSFSFVFALITGLVIQLFLLPVVFRSFHAGHGLLLGNDSTWFYQLAVDLSGQIRAEGWGAWELRPFGQAPAGIMAALFVFLPPKPWVVLPLYAALFASSASLLFLCLQQCGFTRRAAIVGVLPLLLFPSGALLYALPHKDAFSVCGSMMFLWSLLRLGVAGQAKEAEAKRSLVAPFVLGIMGGGLVWVVRPYALEIMMGAGGVISLLATILFLFRALRHRWRLAHASWPGLLMLWLLVFVFKVMVDGGVLLGITAAQSGAPGEALVVGEAPCNLRAQQKGTGVDKGKPEQPGVRGPVPVQENAGACWKMSRGVPDFVEKSLQRLAAARQGYISAQSAAASAIDQTVTFMNVRDVVHYLPRAVQIGLFAPFPTHWVAPGSIAVNTFLRRIIAFEMVIWYGLFPFCLWAAARGPNREGIGIFMAYSLLSLLVFVMAITNMGTVYRMRFGFWMPMVSLALAMLVTIHEKRRQPSCAA